MGSGPQLRSLFLFYPSGVPDRTAIPGLTCKLVIKIVHEGLRTPNSPRVTGFPKKSVCSAAVTSPDSRKPSRYGVNCGESINDHHFERRRHWGIRSATRIDPNGMLNDFEAECFKRQAPLT